MTNLLQDAAETIRRIRIDCLEGMVKVGRYMPIDILEAQIPELDEDLQEALATLAKLADELDVLETTLGELPALIEEIEDAVDYATDTGVTAWVDMSGYLEILQEILQQSGRQK